MNRQKPIPQQIYRHFKGNTYQITCIATDSEDGHECVVYQALYGDFKHYVRPLEMFMSEVDHAKYSEVTQKYRFELIAGPGAQETSDTDIINMETVNLDPDVEAFLDADTYEQRLEVLARMHYKINDDMIDIMSTVVDIEIPAGRVSDRYDKFKDALMLRRSYETSRLR